MENWGMLLPILLSDVINPVLFAFMVYAAGSSRPVLTSSAMLLGHTVTYFSFGIVLSLGLERIAARLANPRFLDFVIEVVLGVILLWLALRTRKDTGKRPEEETPEFSPWDAFRFGALVNVIGIPFAVPYFAAIDQFLKSDLNTGGVLLALLAYNLVYALPFLMVPVLSAVMGERSKPLLARVNAVMERISSFLMPLMLGLVGLALLADSITYFLSGESLF
jgi:threonine/homoserine/homoserine lactone efflux protein